MSAIPQYPQQSHRLDVPLHDLLTGGSTPGAPRRVRPAGEQPQTLPEPVFPQYPKLLNQDDNYEEMLERARTGRRQ